MRREQEKRSVQATLGVNEDWRTPFCSNYASVFRKVDINQSYRDRSRQVKKLKARLGMSVCVCEKLRHPEVRRNDANRMRIVHCCCQPLRFSNFKDNKKICTLSQISLVGRNNRKNHWLMKIQRGEGPRFKVSREWSRSRDLP